MKSVLRKWLELPQNAAGYALDDPRLTEVRRNIILNKPFLKRIYEEWYTSLIGELKNIPPGKIVEIGSGGGFLKTMLPQVITSDIMPLSHCDMAFSAEEMPFESCSLSAIVMVDVLHHIPHPEKFLQEAERTLVKGGKIAMIEPANSAWGRFIYTHFHHEPFNPGGGWEIPPSGPLSGANGAMPWILFERDTDRFREKFPALKITKITYHTPLRYLLSGGVSMRALVPAWSFSFFRVLEMMLSPLSRIFSMFTLTVVEKQ